MRQIDHFIVGGVGSAPSRLGDVFDPNNGGVQAQVTGAALKEFFEATVLVRNVATSRLTRQARITGLRARARAASSRNAWKPTSRRSCRVCSRARPRARRSS